MSDIAIIALVILLLKTFLIVLNSYLNKKMQKLNIELEQKNKLANYDFVLKIFILAKNKNQR